MLVLKPQAQTFPKSFDFLKSDLPTVQATQSAVWTAFLARANLSPADAQAALAPGGDPPLLFAQELNTVIWAQFDPEVPNRIELSKDVLSRFEADSNNPTAQKFLRAKVLHEMCHWGCQRKGIPDPDTAGEQFETDVYGAEQRPWWLTPTAAADSPIDPLLFTDPATRAAALMKTLVGHVPGRSFDPNHAVFGGEDVAEGLPRGYRNNNPGNIRVGISWNGIAEPDDEQSFQQHETSFCVFREPEWGLRAIASTMRAYKRRHNIATPRKIIERWAPVSDGNDVDSYSSKLAQALGVAVDDTVDAEQDDVCIKLMRAIATHENGSKPPYSDTQFQTALKLL